MKMVSRVEGIQEMRKRLVEIEGEWERVLKVVEKASVPFFEVVEW